MKALKYIVSAVAMLPLSISAQNTGEGSTSAYNFLDITPSAHIYGLGGINITTVDDDINSIGQNPALLGP